jgi:hypothetical protein
VEEKFKVTGREVKEAASSFKNRRQYFHMPVSRKARITVAVEICI